jgi:hypothetical protein
VSVGWFSRVLGGAEYDVFISYRRHLGSDLAQLVRRELVARGFRVFLDVRDLHAGRFDETLLRQIEQSAHFVPLLTPGALDRVQDDSDWMRREIAHALACRRPVVPLAVAGFEFPPKLPADLAELPRQQWVRYAHEFSDEAIDRLSDALGKPRPRPTPSRRNWWTRKRIAIACGVGGLALLASVASERDTRPTVPFTPAVGPVAPVVPSGTGGFCCDVAGMRRCGLVAALPLGMQCVCPGQGIGVTCP